MDKDLFKDLVESIKQMQEIIKESKQLENSKELVLEDLGNGISCYEETGNILESAIYDKYEQDEEALTRKQFLLYKI